MRHAYWQVPHVVSRGPVYTENSDSGVLVVQSAKDRMRYDAFRLSFIS
jgi:hypothetical protein